MLFYKGIFVFLGALVDFGVRGSFDDGRLANSQLLLLKDGVGGSLNVNHPTVKTTNPCPKKTGKEILNTSLKDLLRELQDGTLTCHSNTEDDKTTQNKSKVSPQSSTKDDKNTQNKSRFSREKVRQAINSDMSLGSILRGIKEDQSFFWGQKRNYSDNHQSPFSLLHRPKDDDTKDSSIFYIFLCLINSIWGLGVFSIPFAVLKSGWFAGCLLLAIIPVVLGWSLLLLARCSDYGTFQDYAELMEFCFGLKGRRISMASQLVFVMGSLSAYLIILSDNLQKLVAEFPPICNDVLMFGSLVLIFILCLGYDVFRGLLHRLELTPLIAASLTTLATLFSQSAPTNVKALATSPIDFKGFLEGVGLVSFAFVIHPETFDFLSQISSSSSSSPSSNLSSPPSLPRRRGAFKGAIMNGTIFCTLNSILITMAALIKFGPTVDANILNNCSEKSLLANCARIMVILSMIITYPFDYIVAQRLIFPTKRMPFTRFTITFGLVFLSWMLAKGVGKLELILEASGGWAAAALALIFPGICYLRLSSSSSMPVSSKRQEAILKLSCHFIIVSGLLLFIASTVLVFYKLF